MCITDRIKKTYGLLLLGSLCVWIECSDLSKRKCEEYASYVESEEHSPLLRLGSGKRKVSECGILETPLIIGGIKAKSKEFPHQVSVGFGKPLNKFDIGPYPIRWDCGGSIISEYFVLTAAHCVETRDRVPAIRVRAGTVTMNNPDPSVQERVVVDHMKHPEFKPPSKYNDIGLLKLDEPWDFNGFVRPACIETDDPPPGNQGIASGFGVTSYDAAVLSNHLMKVTLDYISESQCEKSFKMVIGTRQMPDGIVPSYLCAGVMKGGKDTCQGDSGGPLQRVLVVPYCMYSIVGITSFGKFCATADSPAIYTRVSWFADWIESIVWPGER